MMQFPLRTVVATGLACCVLSLSPGVVRADLITEVEPNSSIGDANLLVGDNTLSVLGTSQWLGRGIADPDFYRFAVTTPGMVQFTATQLGPFVGAENLITRIYNSTGVPLEEISTADTAVGTFNLESGNYFLGTIADAKFIMDIDYRIAIQGQTGRVIGGMLVPEPSTLPLIAGATLGLLATWRMRRCRRCR